MTSSFRHLKPSGARRAASSCPSLMDLTVRALSTAPLASNATSSSATTRTRSRRTSALRRGPSCRSREFVRTTGRCAMLPSRPTTSIYCDANSHAITASRSSRLSQSKTCAASLLPSPNSSRPQDSRRWWSASPCRAQGDWCCARARLCRSCWPSLQGGRKNRKTSAVASIEQIAPFPWEPVADLIEKYHAEAPIGLEVVWGTGGATQHGTLPIRSSSPRAAG